MATTGPPIRQDLPPPGGYNSIRFQRIPARRLLTSPAIIGGYLFMTITGLYLWQLNAKKTLRLKMEMRGGRFALWPMILAERDRMYLTQLRKNREEEERLMANVPGWVVGTWYGTPIYQSRPADEWHDISVTELFCHADPKYLDHHTEFHKWI